MKVDIAGVKVLYDNADPAFHTFLQRVVELTLERWIQMKGG